MKLDIMDLILKAAGAAGGMYALALILKEKPELTDILYKAGAAVAGVTVAGMARKKLGV